MKNKKSLSYYILYMIFVVIFANVVVDYISEGNFKTISEQPVKFFITAIIFGTLGGIFIWKYGDKWKT